MDHQEFEKLAGMLAKIAYEVHDNESVDEPLREMLLDLWREFDHYNYSND
jgi:hypothetical protein